MWWWRKESYRNWRHPSIWATGRAIPCCFPNRSRWGHWRVHSFWSVPIWTNSTMLFWVTLDLHVSAHLPRPTAFRFLSLNLGCRTFSVVFRSIWSWSLEAISLPLGRTPSWILLGAGWIWGWPTGQTQGQLMLVLWRFCLLRVDRPSISFCIDFLHRICCRMILALDKVNLDHKCLNHLSCPL